MAKHEEEPIKLSKYEDSLPAVELADLSEDALALYHSKVKVGAAVDSEDFRRLLRQQGILVEVDGKTVPSGFGLVLFGKKPGHAMHQARLLARAELPDGKPARKEFGQAMVLVPGELESWLNTVLPSTLDRSRMERREKVDLPFEMVREAVVNALIHRDYAIVEQKCQLIVNADTITIKSPGGLGVAGNQGTNDLRRVFQISKAAVSNRYESPQKVSRFGAAGKVRLRSSYRIHHPPSMSFELFSAIYPARLAGYQFSGDDKSESCHSSCQNGRKGRSRAAWIRESAILPGTGLPKYAHYTRCCGVRIYGRTCSISNRDAKLAITKIL